METGVGELAMISITVFVVLVSPREEFPVTSKRKADNCAVSSCEKSVMASKASLLVETVFMPAFKSLTVIVSFFSKHLKIVGIDPSS